MSFYSINYGKNTIGFSLEHKERKSLKISVMPDLSIRVSAPSAIPIEKILHKVHRRAPWIMKQIYFFKTFIPKAPPRQYISGETHYYLGRQYRLKIKQAKVRNVKLKGKYLIVHAKPAASNSHIKQLVYEWYRGRARDIFTVIADRCLGKLEKYKIKRPIVEIKIMKTRWGSCSHVKNKIRLNTELIKAPSHCIEYVIMHEMSHLKYPNHTKQFYNFLSLVMPDWKERKLRLERVVL